MEKFYISKNTICKLCLMLFISALSQYVNAQGYTRKSLTILMLQNRDDKPIPSNYFSSIVVPDRCDYNNIGMNKIYVNDWLSNMSSYSSTQLEKKIYEERIPNKILRSILIDETKQYMTPAVMINRGLYNASDADFVVAKNSARGIDQLKDSGVKLLQNIYFMVIEPGSLSITKNNDTKANSYSISGTSMLYQLDIDSAYMSKKFWDDFYFDSPNTAKMNKLMNYNFPLKSTVHAFSVSVSDLDAANSVSSFAQMFTNAVNKTNQQVDESKLTRKSLSTIYSQLLDKIVKSSLVSIIGDDGFAVRSSVYKSHPLLSKIGKKEGVRTDDLFEVTEKVMNPKTHKITTRHVGYVRSKWVADNKYNTVGVSKPTSFYRVTTMGISKGMELKEEPISDYALGFSYGIENQSLLGGFSTNIEYTTHLLPGMNVGLDLGINPEQETEKVFLGTKPVTGSFTTTGWVGALTLRQSFSVNYLFITPLAGFFVNYNTLENSSVVGTDGKIITKSKIDADYTKVIGLGLGLTYGADVGININRTVQLRLGYRFSDAGDQTMTADDGTFPYTVKYQHSTYSVGLRFGRL